MVEGVKSLLHTKRQIILLYICWIPSHCGTYGNERTDQLADKRAKMDQRNIPVTYSIAKAKIKSVRWKPTHERAVKVFGERRSPKEEEKSWPEEVRRLYARLRSDHAK